MVTLKLFNVRFNPHWKTTLRQCCEKLFIPLFFLIASLTGTVPLQAQDDSPCECVQRWEKGAHWNEDGTIDDAPNAPSPLGVIRCANAAETQFQIKPKGCTYNPSEFLIDVSGSSCIDPSTGATVTVANPTEGEPIIWFNFDVRAHASNFEVQINDNAQDNIGFALYYSSASTTGLNENGVSGDCSSLVLVACGVESSNTWNTLPVPDFAQATNYYLAIWDQDADGNLGVNNFKARLGCSDETPTPDCSLDLIECPETAKVSCGDPIDPISLGLPFDPADCSNIEIDYSDVIGGICAEDITIKRLWTFKDQSGNTVNCEQMIEFVDETHPVIETIADYTLEDCDAEWPELSTEWSDNCGSGGQVDGEAGEVMVDGCVETRVYTFTVSDDCGNETTATTTVTRKFDELVIACSGDKTIEACATQADIDAAFADFLESFRVKSGCKASGSFDAEYSAPDKCGGMVSVSYTATADCGDPQTCTATFTVTECTTGDCGDCPEACAISGDQEVCPGELAAYSVAFEDGCDSPEVIWSLSEEHDGATIVSEDASTNSVVLKIDNDCEGWIELIATIKCEGCEDVVCTYPIDIALTELVLDCPSDKELEACSSQEDIDAAFKDFLESFGFEGGCDATGSFDSDYSVPDKCGGIVEVKYTVTESCGETQTCSATFSIGICEDGSCNTCEGSCLIGGDIAACPSESLVYTLDLDGVCAEPEVIWTLDGDAEIVETGDGQVTVKTTVDCEGWFTLKATIKCDNCPPVSCEKTVDVVRHKLVVECPEDVEVGECLSDSEVQAAFADFLDDFGFSGGCGDDYGDFAMAYQAPTACGESVTVKYIAQNTCGQYESCTATFSIENCGEGDCGDCPEACAISGDQEVCPGELAAYSVAFEDGCDSPEVIWSLSEEHDGATIVSEDASTNSVVLKIDNDCEGWIELIATIKCEGCEDVVCTYPIDITLTDLVLDCPSDKELEACSSQEDIDAAFKDFLESFGFEGGCDATGSFDGEYSAPDKCGGIVEVKYTVTESCGETQTCSATFRIGICEDGSCNTCEGSCLIGGDIAACPSESLVYTLDLDGVCAEPEVIWTLDGDAEIVETGAGQVTVKTTVDCEGWFTLKATIKCDNCPPVSCEKTVDVVRHKLVVECPEDVVVGECLSDSEVQAAFADFLDDFGFSGGCNDGSGSFEIEYSAPEACGQSVTVKYTAMDNCGQYETCSATFSISACDEECIPEVKDLEDITLEECGAAWPTLETEWWDNCDNDGKVLGVPGEVMTIDDCYQYRIYTFTLFNDCGEDAQTTTKVTRRYDLTPPILSIPNLNVDLVTCIDEIPAPEDLKSLLGQLITDNCDDSPEINITTDGAPECIDGSFSFTYTVKVCDECGNCDEISVTYGGSCEGTPGEQQTFCTLTQGGWGNPGGRYPWKDGEMASTKKILTDLMEVYGAVIIGDMSANTLQVTDPECVLTLLPGGGNPDVLPEGNVSATNDNDCTPYSDEYLTGSGRLKNTLAAQAIVLQLNNWYTLEVSGTDLGALTLESLSITGTEVLPNTVTTIAELLAFTNLYLGGSVETEEELAGSLTELLAAVNEFFDGCREVTFDACGLGWDLTQESEEENAQEEEGDQKDQIEMALVKPLKVWPNPASKQLTLNFNADEKGITRVRLIDPSGKRVFDGTFPIIKGINSVIVPVDGFPAGIYTIITVQDDKQFLERVVITKR